MHFAIRRLLLGLADGTRDGATLAPVTMPPHTVLVLKPEQKRDDGYTSCKRVQ